MNTDRLTTVPAVSIAAGITTKWTNAYSFLGFTWGTTSVNNGITFNSLTQNQFALDLAYYLEPEDLWYLLYQVKDSYVTVTSGTTTLLFTEDNIKQILIHKWNKGITQLPNTPLSSITISGENIIWAFTTSVANSDSLAEVEKYKVDVILTNYLEDYFTKTSSILTYPNITLTYNINWDLIRARFNYRMETNL